MPFNIRKKSSIRRILIRRMRWDNDKFQGKMWWCRGVFIVCVLVQFSTAIIIDLPDGQVEGLTGTTLAGTTYHSFLALRYAQPPVGSLRLQPAQPVQPWQGVYDGTAEKHVCYQVYDNNAKENEDCLFANVFTPVDLTNSSFASDKAVLVWIHGGGFISGAAYMVEGGVGPKFFMDSDLVFVSINYRLGPFGFMSSGDDVIPGNLGLKDQVAALRWVQKNIAHFGGDPTKVTIFGQSAGSASVSYQLLSPQSKGLFRAAILESGSALSPWAYQRYETDITYATAQLIDPNFSSKNSTELLKFLQSVPASAIDNASLLLSSTKQTPENYQISKGFFYAPVIEAPNSDAFLTELQYGLFESGRYNQVPIIQGMTNEESMGLLDNTGYLAVLSSSYDQTPSILVPFDMHITDEYLRSTIGSSINTFFTNGTGFGTDMGKIIRYHSVHDFDRANIKQAELMSAHSTVYFYEFSYSGPMGYFTYRLPGCGNVTHAEEVNYFFSKWYSNQIPDNTNLTYFPVSDRNTHYRIMSLWTNFVKHLNPTPPGVDEEILQHVTWEPVEQDSFKYLDIEKDLILTQGYPKQDKYLFWKQLYFQYGLPPYDTF